MHEKWRYCTRAVCRLRSDRSRDRQIYTRKRHIIGEGGPDEDAAPPGETTPPDSDEPTLPGRYCIGLCEIDPPPQRTLAPPEKAKLLKE